MISPLAMVPLVANSCGNNTPPRALFGKYTTILNNLPDATQQMQNYTESNQSILYAVGKTSIAATDQLQSPNNNNRFIKHNITKDSFKDIDPSGIPSVNAYSAVTIGTTTYNIIATNSLGSKEAPGTTKNSLFVYKHNDSTAANYKDTWAAQGFESLHLNAQGVVPANWYAKAVTFGTGSSITPGIISVNASGLLQVNTNISNPSSISGTKNVSLSKQIRGNNSSFDAISNGDGGYIVAISTAKDGTKPASLQIVNIASDGTPTEETVGGQLTSANININNVKFLDGNLYVLTTAGVYYINEVAKNIKSLNLSSSPKTGTTNYNCERISATGSGSSIKYYLATAIPSSGATATNGGLIILNSTFANPRVYNSKYADNKETNTYLTPNNFNGIIHLNGYVYLSDSTGSGIFYSQL